MMPGRMSKALAAAAAVGWAALAGPPVATAQEFDATTIETGAIPPIEAEPLDTGGEFGLNGGFDPAMMGPGTMTPGMMGPGMMGPGMMGPGMMTPGMGGMYPGMYPGGYPGMSGGYGAGYPGANAPERQTSRFRALLSVLGRPSSGIPGYYNWMRPVRRPLYRTPVTYQKYWPRHYYTGGPAHSPTEAAPPMPVVYQPTDTTQLGVTWQHVPTWQPDPYMVPPTPWPWDWHHLVPAQVYRQYGKDGVIGAGYNPAASGANGYGANGYGANGFGANGFGAMTPDMNGFGDPSGLSGGLSGGLGSDPGDATNGTDDGPSTPDEP